MKHLFRHPLDNIEDVEEFYAAINRRHITRELSADRPYTYWTIELYDQKNGIRGGGGLGVLAADTRRIAEQMNVPFTLITPFYPSEAHQQIKNGQIVEDHRKINYADFGFEFLDTVNIKCNNQICSLDVIEKEFKDAVELQIDAILNYDKYRKQKEVKQHLAEMEKDFYGKIV